MATIINSGARALTVALSSTTAQSWELSEPVNQLLVINQGIAATWIRLYTSTVRVTDDAGITAAVADADDLYLIPGCITSGSMGMRTILRTPRPTFVYGSVVGSGNKVTIEGHSWY